MKHLKTIGFVIIIFWIFALFLTYTPSLFWYAYLFISAIALILAMSLIIYLNPDIYHSIQHFFSNLKKESQNYSIKTKDKKSENYDITTLRQRKDTHFDYKIINTSSANIRHKQYLHTTIPELKKTEKQKMLFEIILGLKEEHFFSSFYAGITEEELIQDYDEYQSRKIYELYDNILPNAYTKFLYDTHSGTNRLSIFIPNKQNPDLDFNLGFIAIEDSNKSDVLSNKYTNIQVIPTILGGTYKEVYKDESEEIHIRTDFDPYDLTISLAFYNI